MKILPIVLGTTTYRNQFDFVYVTGSGGAMFRKIISLLVFLIKAHIYFANPLPQNDEFSEYGEAQEPPNVPSGFCILPKELDYSGNR